MPWNREGCSFQGKHFGKNCVSRCIFKLSQKRSKPTWSTIQLEIDYIYLAIYWLHIRAQWDISRITIEQCLVTHGSKSTNLRPRHGVHPLQHILRHGVRLRSLGAGARNRRPEPHSGHTGADSSTMTNPDSIQKHSGWVRYISTMDARQQNAAATYPRRCYCPGQAVASSSLVLTKTYSTSSMTWGEKTTRVTNHGNHQEKEGDRPSFSTGHDHQESQPTRTSHPSHSAAVSTWICRPKKCSLENLWTGKGWICWTAKGGGFCHWHIKSHWHPGWDHDRTAREWRLSHQSLCEEKCTVSSSAVRLSKTQQKEMQVMISFPTPWRIQLHPTLKTSACEARDCTYIS